MNKQLEEFVVNKITNTKRYIRYFYRANGKIYYMRDITDTIQEQTEEERKQDLKIKYNYFELFEGYDASEQGIEQYIKDFQQCCKVLLKEGSILYKKYYNHRGAVMNTFTRFSKMKDVITEDINFKEYSNLEIPHNGALVYFDEEMKNKVIKSYGYDYSSFFPYLLSKSDFKFPIKKPKYIKLTQEKFTKQLRKGTLKYGLYNVKIILDKKFKDSYKTKFALTDKNKYDHQSLNYMYSQKDKYNMEFKLYEDSEHMVYSDDSLISSKDIFEPWFNILIKVKNKNKNMLIKHLMSSIWGYLCEKKTIYMNEDAFNALNDEDVSSEDDPEETKYKIIHETPILDSKDNITFVYALVNKDDPYKYNLARLKPFFMSYVRCYIGKVIENENLENKIFRIHTDGIVLTEMHNFTTDKYKPIPESKTTGLILWKNLNSYYKYCTKCECCYNQRSNILMNSDKKHKCK